MYRQKKISTLQNSSRNRRRFSAQVQSETGNEINESIINDFEPLLASNVLEFNEELFRSSYEHVIQLLQGGTDTGSATALMILNQLCEQLKKVANSKMVPLEVAENVVVNTWKLRTEFNKSQQSRTIQYDILSFIREYTQVLINMNEHCKVARTKLSLLYLIQAKQEFLCGLYKEALVSCDLSCKHLHGPRDALHNVKVHFLKCKIYNAMKQPEAELTELTKCERYARKMICQSQSERVELDLGKDILAQLETRKMELNNMAELGEREPKSAPKIRKRSISLAKLGMSNDILKNRKPQQGYRGGISKFVKTRSQSKIAASSKLQQIKAVQKPILKLKKRPLKITNFRNVQSGDNYAYELANISSGTPCPPNYEDMLLRRPKEGVLRNQVADEVAQHKPDRMVELIEDSIQNEIVNDSGITTEKLTDMNNQSDYELSRIIRMVQLSIFESYLAKRNQLNSSFKESQHDKGSEQKLNMSSEQLAKGYQSKQNDSASGVERGQVQILSSDSAVFENQSKLLQLGESICSTLGTIEMLQCGLRIVQVPHKSVQIHNKINKKQLNLRIRGKVGQIGYSQLVLVFPIGEQIIEPNHQIVVDKVLNMLYDDQQINELHIQFSDMEILNRMKKMMIILRSIMMNNSLLGKKLGQKIVVRQDSFTQKYFLRRMGQFIIEELGNRVGIRGRTNEVAVRSISNNIQTNNYIIRKQKAKTVMIRRTKTQRQLPITLNIITHNTKVELYEVQALNSKYNIKQPQTIKPVRQAANISNKIHNYFSSNSSFSPKQLYHCMKYILIRPLQLQKQIVDIFYDRQHITELCTLACGKQVVIKMTCLRAKQIFLTGSELYFSFELSVPCRKTMKMKFIATGHDIDIFTTEKECQSEYIATNKQVTSKWRIDKIRRIRSERETQSKVSFRKTKKMFNHDQHYLFSVLQAVSQRIFIKKDVLYFSIGFQAGHQVFHYANQFLMQSGVTRNKNFLTAKLKLKHVLCQKAIKIHCGTFNSYGVVTVLKIQKASRFDVLIYFPIHQKTYSFNLDKSIVGYITQTQLKDVFGDLWNDEVENREKLLFEEHREQQRLIWNRLLGLLKFEVQKKEEMTILIAQIGRYKAFIKNCCLNQYFELEKRILHLEMSLQRKDQTLAELKPMATYSKTKRIRQVQKNTAKVIQQTKKFKKGFSQSQLEHGEVFDEINRIYLSEAGRFILYISLTDLLNLATEQSDFSCSRWQLDGEDINSRQKQQESKQLSKQKIQKLNVSFSLSDALTILREENKMHQITMDDLQNELKEEFFSYAVILRALVAIKFRIIQQISTTNLLAQLFENTNALKTQRRFKQLLRKVFTGAGQQQCSLNSLKKQGRGSASVASSASASSAASAILFTKSIISVKNSTIVSIFTDSKQDCLRFFVSNCHKLSNKERREQIDNVSFPHIRLFTLALFLGSSARFIKYYKNSLLFSR